MYVYDCVYIILYTECTIYRSEAIIYKIIVIVTYVVHNRIAKLLSTSPVEKIMWQLFNCCCRNMLMSASVIRYPPVFTFLNLSYLCFFRICVGI